ncbi:MAG: (deoxy)nucleoside triphosphate pyrophosphohydrolase [Deltaproteobacteria bacterium]|nr:(deoxy)nucleoside triphosphate pyrophosphohydrolase [Deltaproteobacteria bacterium]
MAEPKVIDVVAGLIFQKGRVLACQRHADGSFPLKWEFPGGKIESGEQPATALVRELREELGVEIHGIEQVYSHTHKYAGSPTVRLKFFHVSAYRGRIVNRVFEQVRWVGADELSRLDFLEGDLPVIEWLASGKTSALWQCAEV